MKENSKYAGWLAKMPLLLFVAVALFAIFLLWNFLDSYSVLRNLAIRDPLQSKMTRFKLNCSEFATDVRLVMVLPATQRLQSASGNFCKIRIGTKKAVKVNRMGVEIYTGIEKNGERHIAYSLGPQQPWQDCIGGKDREVSVQFEQLPPNGSSLYIFWMQPRNAPKAVQVDAAFEEVLETDKP